MADLPEWLAGTLFALVFLMVLFGVAIRNTRRLVRHTKERRHNPSREEFMAAMGADVSSEAANFIWEAIIPVLSPQLTPHPDDDMGKDLPLDPEEWSLDWPREYAQQQGFHESNLPDWPEGWPPTIRNYGRWLSMGPVA